MIYLNEYNRTLNEGLDELQKTINSLSKKEYSQKQDGIKQCEAQVKIISSKIESYQLEIYLLDKAQSVKYKDLLESINQRFLQLQSELKFKKNEAQKYDNLFKGRSNQQPQGLEDMNSQQVIEMGDQLQKDASIIVDRTIGIVQQGNDLAEKIIMDIDQQIAQLDSMYDKVKDTQSVLKRSAEKIKYFAKQVYTDKLLMCLIGLIFIAIIVLIVLSALGLDDGKFMTPDQVKGSLASDSSSNMNTSAKTASK
ncbi:unnamed protein product (macronuclear) [Paramecium tetraurelia]|uniref:Vesicle transport v-SNARE N-terminal domain-containing protein n=1 Tax=Paramecium tetraurelia TaxID=5888 RepID=A0D1N1_PARTE|nr:uncharacterized protein GSPATT00012472001 [Paramecium tetraurelia]CAK76948.1 unnamed protein product [Paramecium tetraurelia]|eukprot:XP_001444345.1 hypothetical protein (macronuclear) [Paramecium tetraurelia strain d4-2]